MSRDRKWIYTIVLGVIALTLILLCIVTAHHPDRSVHFHNPIPAYEGILTSFDHPLYIAYENQAVPLMQTGIVKAYRTDFISTAIIAVDRDQVEDEITGWNSLLTGDYPVYFDYKGKLSHVGFGYTFLAMTAGLDYDNSGYQNTIHLLRHLHHNGRLIPEDPSDAPVAIMFDYQAAQRNKDGQNIEIIVPAEGTLSFPAGIISTRQEQLSELNPSDLLAAGFRLPNGESDPSIYPDAGQYSSAQNAVLNHKDAMHIINAVPAFRRMVLGERLFSTAHGVEHMLSYLAFIIILILWSGMLYIRISDKALQKKLFAISMLLLFWMLVKVIKLLVPDGIIDRFFWYLYYIPLIFLPTILFWIGLILDKSDQNRFPRWIRKTSLVISILLAMLVLSNDFHQMAFRFYLGTEGNIYDQYYSYGWVYYLIFARSLYLIFAFVLMAARRKPGSAAQGIGTLLLLLGISLIYFGGYAWGLPIFRESDFSIVYGTMTLLFLEVCLRSRLIPNNIRLGELLRFAPIDMHILTDAMHIEYQTDHSEELSPEIIEQIRHLPPEATTPVGLSLPYNESILYGVYRINGGYSIFTQHLDPVIRLRTALTEQNRKIKIQNSILARTHKVQSEIARLRTQQELFSRIDEVLKDRVNKINAIISALPVNNTNEGKDKVQQQLSIIKILVNYCKRRGNLALLEAGGEYCDTASLALWLRESLWEASSAGIEGMVTETGNVQIHSSPAALLYDCFEDTLEKTMKYAKAVMLANLSSVGESVVLRIAVETAPAADSADLPFEYVLQDALDSMGASYGVHEHDDGFIIQITVPMGGREND
ncbi:hypothetical protein ASZ90_017078 [hydrocarbon metagenome]|uniref:Histidine kinase N-terminal 7TM region domain-containing protein n=1 Tax=hydrocarbon metagenome TaxID=938273 RepID=A0A0W8EA49_9ZZZZ